jgi:Phospholipase_D-nuclease N-terminal
MPTTYGPEPTQLIVVVVAVLLTHLALATRAPSDLSRPDRRVRLYTKQVWTIVIVLVGIVGPLFYLYAGREDDW